MYGFLAPTGRFAAGADNNVGSGILDACPVVRADVLSDAGTSVSSLSAFQMYEFHTTQEGTGVHPGETFDLDYSLMDSLAPHPALPVCKRASLDMRQRQTTAKIGPGISPEESAERYAVNALGFAQ